ncbi:SSI family serine proteinase inhibitor [Streptomyces aidingensis]|uniref:SSI family serine proteinase inhibitor n=1 Tax=Streptomyces aidingensis TaxID=910347 RepID=UPI00158797B2|nr:SSI family serine proteinase inhibitor [Streptomyces aidingensis]
MAVAALALGGIGAPTAAAATPEPPPASELTLRLEALSGPGFLNRDLPREVVLECEPAGGSHPAAQDACRSLLRVGGQFERLSGQGACPDVWEPVLATAEGTWQGRAVSYSEIFGNLCDAAVGTDHVFAF